MDFSTFFFSKIVKILFFCTHMVNIFFKFAV